MDECESDAEVMARNIEAVLRNRVAKVRAAQSAGNLGCALFPACAVAAAITWWALSGGALTWLKIVICVCAWLSVASVVPTWILQAGRVKQAMKDIVLTAKILDGTGYVIAANISYNPSLNGPFVVRGEDYRLAVPMEINGTAQDLLASFQQ